MDTTQVFERLLLERGREHYVLRLYVSGMSPRSTEAVSAIKALCDEWLPGRYELEIVDIYQDAGRAKSAQIIASPTLVKELPAPICRMIGDLTNKERVLHGLSLSKRGTMPSA